MAKQLELRFIKTVTESYKEQMAIDEANMLAVAQGIAKPSLRICYFKKPSVAIGYSQSVEEEVNLKACNALGVEIFRRMTGGGAVFKDPEKELNYSIIIPEEFAPGTIIDSYEKLCAGIVLGLKHLGLNAEFKPVNDIIINGKKVSGNAQTRFKGVILQHGTLLIDVDVDKMFSVLKVSDEKIRDKMIANVKQRVTSLKHELGFKPSFEAVEQCLIKGFEQALNAKIVPEELTSFEKQKIIELYNNKYNTDDWNFKR
ncbi:lipoate--protein ligase family protein [Candidatus Woesearchaeota archaeon]|nr:lipoate--protein ligase family protein [Candidatus Woesearchaeota archaeon]